MPTFNINETMDAIIDPLIQMCEMSVQKFNDMDRQIYLINCIQHIQACTADGIIRQFSLFAVIPVSDSPLFFCKNKTRWTPKENGRASTQLGI